MKVVAKITGIAMLVLAALAIAAMVSLVVVAYWAATYLFGRFTSVRLPWPAKYEHLISPSNWVGDEHSKYVFATLGLAALGALGFAASATPSDDPVEAARPSTTSVEVIDESETATDVAFETADDAPATIAPETTAPAESTTTAAPTTNAPDTTAVTASSTTNAPADSATDTTSTAATAVATTNAPDATAVTSSSTTNAPAESTTDTTSTAATAVAATVVTVTNVVDGDTIDVATGDRIRIIGIDTPERGECGFEQATAAMSALVLNEEVILVDGARDDIDRYGRLLRYVDLTDGTDTGLTLIEDGLAIARYDSRDGYGKHDREYGYQIADFATEAATACAPTTTTAPAPAPTTTATPQPTPTPAPQPEPEPAPEPQPAAELWNTPGPDLDCKDIGMKVRITGPDYHRLDRDGDGWGCESYG